MVVVSANIITYYGKITTTITIISPVYDDFSSDTLNINKWEEVIATNMGTGMVNEYYVENGIYHTAQTTVGDGGIGLVFKDIIFKPGDRIKYDVNYISGSGNRISTMMLNDDAYSTAFLGFWNTLADAGGNNDYGIHHIKIMFLSEGVNIEITRPNGYESNSLHEFPSEKYTFGIVTRTGHNGLVHMDYDNVYIWRAT